MSEVHLLLSKNFIKNSAFVPASSLDCSNIKVTSYHHNFMFPRSANTITLVSHQRKYSCGVQKNYMDHLVWLTHPDSKFFCILNPLSSDTKSKSPGLTHKVSPHLTPWSCCRHSLRLQHCSGLMLQICKLWCEVVWLLLSGCGWEICIGFIASELLLWTVRDKTTLIIVSTELWTVLVKIIAKSLWFWWFFNLFCPVLISIKLFVSFIWYQLVQKYLWKKWDEQINSWNSL